MVTSPAPLPPAGIPVLDGDNNLTLPWRRALQGVGQSAAGGITELTGEVEAGPGGGVQTATLSLTGVLPGTYSNPDLTIDAKGRVTHAADGPPADTSSPPLLFATGSLLDGALTVSAAYKLAHARTFTYTGDATGGPTSFNGTANVSTALTLASTAVTPGTYGDASNVGQFTVDAKGRVTSASNVPISGAAGGTVTSVNISSTNLTVGGGPITGSGTLTVALPATAVSAGSYTSANITVDAFGRLTAAANGSSGAGTVTSVGATSASGDLSISGSPITTSGSFTFTVNSAPKWTTARTLSFTGDVTGSGSVDGSANVATALTLASTAVTPGSYTSADITVDAKGRITAAANGSGGSGTVTTTGSPASGNLAKFSGATSVTNGDLSGDVTTSGTLAATIANDAVTYAKMQNVSAASKLLGRGDSGSGDPQEITLGTGLGMSGTTLTATSVSSLGAEVLITEVVTSASQANVTFSSIPATYRDLIIRVRGRASPAATAVNISVQFNGDTGGNYDSQYVQGASTTASAGVGFGGTSATAVQITGASANANFPGAGDLVIYDYRGTTFDKIGSGVCSQVGASAAIIFSVQWRSTAAINSVKLFPTSGNFIDGSVVSLYGRY